MEYSVKENCVFFFTYSTYSTYRYKWIERMKVGIIDEYRLRIFTHCASDSTFV